MNVLVACEESQIVTSAFRNLGATAFSCDLKLPSGSHPEWAIVGDCVPVCLDPRFQTLSGDYFAFPKWDLIIAHPPCTYLSRAGARWFNKDLPGYEERIKLRNEAISFFKFFLTLDSCVCVENPYGFASAVVGPCTQVVQPYWFGDPVRKAVCLWLRGLPKLSETHYVQPELYVAKDGCIKSTWLKNTVSLPKDKRSEIRSKFFPGIAAAMAEQWIDCPSTLF